jgi:hypothetical protein
MEVLNMKLTTHVDNFSAGNKNKNRHFCKQSFSLRRWILSLLGPLAHTKLLDYSLYGSSSYNGHRLCKSFI